MTEKAVVVDYVKERLVYLHSLKKHRMAKYWKYRNEYSQDNINTITDDGFTNYHLNIGMALANSKAAEIFANTPKYDFVGIDKNGRMYKRMMEKAWEWIWKKSNTNKAIGDIIMDAMKYGSGFGIESYVEDERMVRHPTLKADGTIEFGEPTAIKGGYKGCKLKHLEWHNVYIAGSDMDGITEAIIISHLHIDEFMQKLGNKYGVDKELLTRGKQYYVSEGAVGLTMPDTSRSLNVDDNDNTVSIIEYYNKWEDEYIIIAGETHINQYEGGIMPLLDPHKEIPLVCYIDHAVDSDAYGRGEFEITEKTRQCINDTRSLKIETVKLQGGIITIDPGSDFDETVQRIGLKQYAHIEKDALGFFQPNISTNSLDILSRELNEDIIIESGVDHRGQIFGPNETAEKTKGRIDAQRKRINKNIRDNAFTFYERLARLRMENIKTYYGEVDVPVLGMDVDAEGNSTPLGKGEWGIMKLSKEILKGNVMLLPVIDSIYGDNSKEQRQKWLDFYQLAVNAKDENGKPLYPPALLWSSAIGIMDDVVDIPELLGNNSLIDQELEKELQERGISNLPPPMDGGQGPSPYQQSGAPIVLPSQAASE